MGQNPKCPGYIWGKNQGDKLKYISLTGLFTQQPSPMLAKYNINSKLASASGCHVFLRYTRCRPTHPIPVQCWASVTAHCCFNADKLSMTLAQHYSNTGSSVYLAAERPSKHCFNVGPASSTLARYWNGIAWLSPCLLTAMRMTLSYPDARKATSQITDTLAQCWCDDGPPSATVGQHYLNQALITNMIMNIIFSQHF